MRTGANMKQIGIVDMCYVVCFGQFQSMGCLCWSPCCPLCLYWWDIINQTLDSLPPMRCYSAGQPCVCPVRFCLPEVSFQRYNIILGGETWQLCSIISKQKSFQEDNEGLGQISTAIKRCLTIWDCDSVKDRFCPESWMLAMVSNAPGWWWGLDRPTIQGHLWKCLWPEPPWAVHFCFLWHRTNFSFQQL